MVVIWEVTRACDLACRHCRASAIRRRNPLELTTPEAEAFIEQVVRAAPKFFILTGGDPMLRPDLLHLVRYATDRGLHVSMSPSATPRLLETDLVPFREAGLRRISLSIDGATQRTHDRFRGIRGTWTTTMAAIQAAADAGLEFQINTTFTRQNLEEFDAFVHLMEELRPKVWSVFLLVPTGRARAKDLLTGEEVERLFGRLADLAQTAPFLIKTTEGQHYRRVALQRWTLRGGARRPVPVGINDGKGFVFVSHTGEIQPSGFLPLTADSVLTAELLDVYRDHSIFRLLRDPDRLEGKCGRCEFRKLCGGSRARAYALTGNYLAEEPLCTYQPGKTRRTPSSIPTRL
jgi:radical SAM protein with 4Fe4S-binding SPASM domain